VFDLFKLDDKNESFLFVDNLEKV